MARHKWKYIDKYERYCLKCGFGVSGSRTYPPIGACPETLLVQRFKPDLQYRFAKDYTYDLYPLPKVECKRGDVVIFTGHSIGVANFVMRDKRDKEGRRLSFTMMAKTAFEYLQEIETEAHSNKSAEPVALGGKG